MTRSNKKLLFMFGVLMLAAGLFVVLGHPALAQDTSGSSFLNKLGDVLVSIPLVVVSFLVQTGILVVGKTLNLLVAILVDVSQYNNFINSVYVDTGWRIVRDLVNMFFILGLLLISFGTVLKVQAYNWQKLLPRLVIMAILVNFSKVITGLVIDFFQIVMITFVNAYKGIAGGNLFQALHIADIVTKNENVTIGGAVDNLAAQIFGFIFLLVSVVVIFLFLGILLMRIVAIWILIIFSPLAFFSWIFQGSGIGSFFDKWKRSFFDYLIIGPFLAFFLWLSLATAAQLQQDIGDFTPTAAEDRADITATASAAGTFDNTLSFLITITMLIAGLKFSSEFKVAGGAAISQFADRVTDYGRRAGRALTVAPLEKAGELATRPARSAYEAARGFGRGRIEAAAERLRTEGFAPRSVPTTRLGAAVQAGARILGQSFTKQGIKEFGERAEARGRRAGGPFEFGAQSLAQLKDYEKRADEYGKNFEARGLDLTPDQMREERDRAIKTRNVEAFMYFNKKIAGTKGWTQGDTLAAREAMSGFDLNDTSQKEYLESLEKMDGMEGQAISDITFDENTGEYYKSDIVAESKGKIANETDPAKFGKIMGRAKNLLKFEDDGLTDKEREAIDARQSGKALSGEEKALADSAEKKLNIFAARAEGFSGQREHFGRSPEKIRKALADKIDFIGGSVDEREKMYTDQNKIEFRGRKMSFAEAQQAHANRAFSDGTALDEQTRESLNETLQKYAADKGKAIKNAEFVKQKLQKDPKAWNELILSRQALGKVYHGNGREKGYNEGQVSEDVQLGPIFSKIKEGQDIINKRKPEAAPAPGTEVPKTKYAQAQEIAGKDADRIISGRQKLDVRNQVSGRSESSRNARAYIQNLIKAGEEQLERAKAQDLAVVDTELGRDLDKLEDISSRISRLKEGRKISGGEYSSMMQELKGYEEKILGGYYIAPEARQASAYKENMRAFEEAYRKKSGGGSTGGSTPPPTPPTSPAPASPPPRTPSGGGSSSSQAPAAPQTPPAQPKQMSDLERSTKQATLDRMISEELPDAKRKLQNKKSRDNRDRVRKLEQGIARLKNELGQK